MNDSAKQARLTPLEVDRGLRRSVIAGCFASLFGVCLVNQFLTGFVLAMAGEENKRAAAFVVALLTTIPNIAFAFQLWSAALTERLRERRKLWFRLSMVGRMMWPLIAVTPLLLGRQWLGTQLVIFLVLFFLFSAANSAQSPVWFSWMADLVPKDQAGRYWGQRRAMLNIIGLAIFAAAWFVDWGKAAFGKDSLLPYSLLFALGAVVGIMDVLIHNTVPEPPMHGEPRRLSWWQMVVEPLSDPQYQRFMLYMCSWSFVVNFGNAFLSLLFLQELGLSQMWIAFFSCAMVLTRVFMARYWGYLVDRYGAAPLNSICTFGLVLVPLGFVFVNTHNAIPLITLVFVYSGFFNIGIETTQTALMLGISPAANKAMFVAVVQSLAGLCGAVSPILGALFLNWAMDHPLNIGAWLHLGTWQVTRFQELFLVAYLLRICTAPLSLRLSQIQPGSIGLVVRRLFDANPFSVIHHTYVLSGSSAEAERIEAVRKLAEARSRIATVELSNALLDPSLDVRIEAARALGRIGDAEAVDPLIDCLKSSDSGIQQEAASALGKIADPRGVHALLEVLDDPNVRHTAIKALGEIGDSIAVHPLLDLLPKDSSDLSTRIRAAEAISRIVERSAAAYDVLPHIFAVFREVPASLLRQQLALAIGNLLGEPGGFYDLLAQELRLPGQGVARFVSQLQDKTRPSRWAHPKRRRENDPAEETEDARLTELLEFAQTHYAAEHWTQTAHYFAVAGLAWANLIALGKIPPTLMERRDDLPGLVQELDSLQMPTKRKAKLWFLAHAGVTPPAVSSVPQEESLLALYALAGLWEEKR